MDALLRCIMRSTELWIKKTTRDKVVFKKYGSYPPHLELLALLDPDLDLGDVSEPGPAKKSDLLHFGQGLRILGVDLVVVDTLCIDKKDC